MVLVDFSLAFNCVSHRKLGQKLREEFHFTPDACQLISSFLSRRTQIVKTTSATSAAYPVTDGTPQGSCLSALLFSFYINSLPEGLRCQYQLYADDLQIYISGPKEDVDQLVEMVNADLKTIENWAKRNELFPNPKKPKPSSSASKALYTQTLKSFFAPKSYKLLKESSIWVYTWTRIFGGRLRSMMSRRRSSERCTFSGNSAPFYLPSLRRNSYKQF